jgi:hypothetical protein
VIKVNNDPDMALNDKKKVDRTYPLHTYREAALLVNGGKQAVLWL